MLPTLRSILFDFDGLILDTEYMYYDSWREVYESFGLSLALHEWAALIARGSAVLARAPYEDIENRVGRTLDHDLIRVDRRAAFDRLMAREPLMPGVEELLADVEKHDLLLAVVSSSPRDWVIGYLDRFRLSERFHAICCGDDVPRPKPAPDVYLTALRCLGITAEQAVALEDSVNGIAAAKAAGLVCIAVPNKVTITTDLSLADLQVRTLMDMSVERLIQIHRHGLR